MDEVVNYVMETPGNTNPNVLRGLLGKSGGGNVLIVNMNINQETQTATLDKTWREIYDADFAIVQIITNAGKNFSYIIGVDRSTFSNNYKLLMVGFTYDSADSSVEAQGVLFLANSENDYPQATLG